MSYTQVPYKKASCKKAPCKKVPDKKASYKIGMLTALTIALSACGGSGSETVDNALNDANESYKNIATDVRDAYKKVEDKLTNKEKSMAEILQSIFLPEDSLDNFLDKITPEGGKGGLYVGYFVEDNDNEPNDSDLGVVYFDIGNDYAASVYGQMSYQQKTCQDPNTLTTEKISIKTDQKMGGVLSGTLDPAAKFDNTVLKFLQFDELKTSVAGMPFNGDYDSNRDYWDGQYSYQVGVDFGRELSDNKDGCDVNYTLGGDGDFKVLPLTATVGKLDVNLTGTGSTLNLNWTAPASTARTLVTQINLDKATDRGMGFVRTNQLTYGTTFTPFVDATKANYAFVVQTFDATNKLTGYQAMIKAL